MKPALSGFFTFKIVCLITANKVNETIPLSIGEIIHEDAIVPVMQFMIPRIKIHCKTHLKCKN